MLDDMTYDVDLVEEHDNDLGDIMIMKFDGVFMFQKKRAFTFVDVIKSIEKKYENKYAIKSAVITSPGKFNFLTRGVLYGTRWCFNKDKVLINGEKYVVQGTRFIFQF